MATTHIENPETPRSAKGKRPAPIFNTTFSGVDPFPSFTNSQQLNNSGKSQDETSPNVTNNLATTLSSSSGKKRPSPMTNFIQFGGTDPFPSTGTPQATATAAQLMAMAVSFEASAAPMAFDEMDSKEPLSSTKADKRPSLTLVVDECNSGVDPMPSLDIRRIPGVMSDPFDDDFYPDDSRADNLLDFDEEIEKMADLTIAAEPPVASA